MTRACPSRPSDPPSTNGTSFELRSAPSSSTSSRSTSTPLSQRRASIESSQPTMRWNFSKEDGGSFVISSRCGITCALGTRALTNLAATSVLERPTSAARNRNCRFRLVTSITSMSTTSMRRNPDSARSFNTSHPSPPAPITKNLARFAHEAPRGLRRIRVEFGRERALATQ
eukprot:IDg23510t1